MPEITDIRIATETDKEALMHFLRKPEVDGSFIPPLSARVISIEDRVDEKIVHGFWIVAFDGSKLIGCRGCNGVVDTTEQIVEFSTLAVDSHYRHKGIARQLMQLAFQTALKLYSPRKMRFDSWLTNTAVAHLAQDMGFKKTRVYQDPKRPDGILSVEYIWTRV